MVGLGQLLGIGVHPGAFEEDEDTILARYSLLREDCIDFRLSDSVDRTDATGLWNEALVGARQALAGSGYDDPASIDAETAAILSLPDGYLEAVGHTRLGTACRSVIEEIGTNAGAI